jgi:hypothetical protein
VAAGLILHEAWCLPPNRAAKALDAITNLVIVWLRISVDRGAAHGVVLPDIRATAPREGRRVALAHLNVDPARLCMLGLRNA